MARIKGKDGVILIGSDPVGQLRSFSVDETSDTAEGTVMGMDDKEFEATQQSWTGSADALLDVSDTGQGVIVAGAEVAIKFHPEGTGVGLAERAGNIVVTGVTENQAHDGFAEVSFSFQGSGPLSRNAQTV